MISCPDLRVLAAGAYRVKREESYAADFGKLSRRRDLWTLIIPCQHGHFFPYGPNRLGFATKCRGGIARKLAALPFTKVEQDGDDGMNLSFPVSCFSKVVELVKPKRRRILTEEQKAVMAERLAKVRKTTQREP